MRATAVSAFLLAAIPAVLGHAGITRIPIRQPGNAFLQKCGKPSFDQVKGDQTGHIEEQEPVNDGCELTLCRGMLFADQPASSVQKVAPGQQMTMGVDCTIPHGGPANVSLIDTTTGGSGTRIGSFLKTFDDFCPTSGQTPADQANLQFTLPPAAAMGNKCQIPGDCVVQLFWATPDFSQNYYYCVDVAMANVAAAPKPSSVAAPTSTAAPSSTPITVPSSKAVPPPSSSQVVLPPSSSSDFIFAPSSSQLAAPSSSVENVISPPATAVSSPSAVATTSSSFSLAAVNPPATSSSLATVQAPASSSAPAAAAVTPAVQNVAAPSTLYRMVTISAAAAQPSGQVAAAQAQAQSATSQTSGARRHMRLLWF